MLDIISSYVTIYHVNPDEVGSLVVAEVPAAIILRYILGLNGREDEGKKKKDREELAKTIAEAIITAQKVDDERWESED